jgi:hypothetical protein
MMKRISVVGNVVEALLKPESVTWEDVVLLDVLRLLVKAEVAHLADENSRILESLGVYRDAMLNASPDDLDATRERALKASGEFEATVAANTQMADTLRHRLHAIEQRFQGTPEA